MLKNQWSKPILGFCAYSGTGKTTLLTQLIPILRNRGIQLGVIKHAHHNFEADHEGKDSYRLRAAGSRQVLVSSVTRSALFTENRSEEEPSLKSLLSRLEPARLVLVEGFKKEFIPKLEIWQKSNQSPLLYLQDETILAMVTNDDILDLPIPRFHLNEIQKIADFIISTVGIKF